MSAPEETKAGADIVPKERPTPDVTKGDVRDWLLLAANELPIGTKNYCLIWDVMGAALKEISDLRAANARLADAANAETSRRLLEATELRAHNTRLSAELDAARGKEGR